MNTNRTLSISMLAVMACTSFTDALDAQIISPVPAATAAWGYGNIYYVDPGGSDANAGTLASPWQAPELAVARAPPEIQGGWLGA
jgi:hypothetical protein